MKIRIKKELQPILVPETIDIKLMQLYNIDNYTQNDDIIDAPSIDTPIDKILTIARNGSLVEQYEVWYEIPDVNLSDAIPDGVSWKSLDVNPPLIWSDVTLFSQGTSSSIRYWQLANNGQFVVNDYELITDAGFDVLSKSDMLKRLSETDFENDPFEDIIYIDNYWRFNGYFDIVHAYIRMKEIYEEKGIDDNARWDASTDVEKEILVRWNQVGLNKAATIGDASWSEARLIKEIGKKYREFNINMVFALEKRFKDWYQYLNMLLSNSGKTKFASDWNWILKDEYIHRFIRQYELSVTNELVNFNQTVLSTYIDGDFLGTIPSAAIVSNLEKVLNAETYPI